MTDTPTPTPAPVAPDPAAVLFKARAMVVVNALGQPLADPEQFTDHDLVRITGASKALAATATALAKAALEQLAERHKAGDVIAEPGYGRVRMKLASVELHRHADAMELLARRHWGTDTELPEVVRLFLRDLEAILPASVKFRVKALDALKINRADVIRTDTAGPDSTPVPDWTGD